MTAGRCAATYNANSNSGLILPLLRAVWDPTWNQWKHLLETKIEVEGTFVQSGKYRKRGGAWDLLTWETALPSRLEIKLPSDFQQQLEKAQRTYHRFGQLPGPRSDPVAPGTSCGRASRAGAHVFGIAHSG